MCEPMTAMMVLTAASTAMKMKADGDQAGYAAGVARNNATMADYAATDAQRRGDLEAQPGLRQTAQRVGAPRAGYAAKGRDLADGTPGEVIEQTNFFGKADSATARYNGALDAYGKKVQGQNFRSQADAAEYNGRTAVAGDLLSGASAVAGHWAQYGSPKKPANNMTWYE